MNHPKHKDIFHGVNGGIRTDQNIKAQYSYDHEMSLSCREGGRTHFYATGYSLLRAVLGSCTVDPWTVVVE